jgi:hypothetical protein
MGGVLNFLTGAGDAQRSIEKGLTGQKDLYDKAVGNLSPWSDAGKTSLQLLMDSLSNKQDPTSYYNNIMGGYSESPYAKLLTEKGVRAGNQGAAASGMLGSGENQKWLTDYSQQVASKDMNDYLKNIFGITDSYERGQSGISQEGLGAAGSQSGLYGRLGDSYLQGKEDQGSVEQQGKQSILSMIGSAAGGMNKPKMPL